MGSYSCLEAVAFMGSYGVWEVIAVALMGSNCF